MSRHADKFLVLIDVKMEFQTQFWKRLLFVFLCSFLENVHSEAVNILYVTDLSNEMPNKAMDAVKKIMTDTVDGTIDTVVNLALSNTDPSDVANQFCDALSSAVKSDNPPDIIMDLTLIGIISETVKGYTRAAKIPTISASYKMIEEQDQWRGLTEDERKYLIPVMPPGDIMSEAVRAIVKENKIIEAFVFYDDLFKLDYTGKNLFNGINNTNRFFIAPLFGEHYKQGYIIKFYNQGFLNFFFMGSKGNLEQMLQTSQQDSKLELNKINWFLITKDLEDIECNECDFFVYIISPAYGKGDKKALKERDLLGADIVDLDVAFYLNLITQTVKAVSKLKQQGKWTKNMISCDELDINNLPEKPGMDFFKTFEEEGFRGIFGSFKTEENERNWMEFQLNIDRINLKTKEKKTIGFWKSGWPYGTLSFTAGDSFSKSEKGQLRVITIVQPPFVQRTGDDSYEGLVIDLMKMVAKKIPDFTYSLTAIGENYEYGIIHNDGKWDGMVRQLLDDKADIAVGAFSVTNEREQVIDFTAPFYHGVGIGIMMRKPTPESHLFKFLTVLESDVWYCITAAFFLTSILMWTFDIWSPYSYQNNKEKYKDDEEQRIFGIKESLWFCMTSLTPQGGGEAPKNLSGRLIAATWWLFGFIIIASYTANLAAFLTVSKLEAPIEDLVDLSNQYKVQYAPMKHTINEQYFERMAGIEQQFYEIWKDMSLNDSMDEFDRSKLAVWDYPISDRYTKIWQSIKETKPCENISHALYEVKTVKSSSEGIALLGEGSEIDYYIMTDCEVIKVGPEFSLRPYAFGVKKGSPLKDILSKAIIEIIQDKYSMSSLKKKWWTKNPKRKYRCRVNPNESDGISLANIGGVFIAVVIGIIFSTMVIFVEVTSYFCRLYKYKPGDQNKVETRMDGGVFFKGEANPFLTAKADLINRDINVATVNNTW